MSVKEIVSFAASKNLMISKDSIDLLEHRSDKFDILEELAKRNEFSVTPELINTIISAQTSKAQAIDSVESLERVAADDSGNVENVIVERPVWKPLAKEFESKVNVHERFDFENNSQSRGEYQDFLDYFHSKFDKLSTIINQGNNKPIVPISKLPTISRGKSVSIVCMVYEKATTKNGHIIMTVDDLSGRFKVLISKKKEELMKLSGRIIEDDVLLMTGAVGNDIMFLEEIKHPDILIKTPKTIEEDLRVVVTSDVHVGHTKFSESAFDKFIEWLNGRVGNKKQQDLAGKVKYLIINGDLVDGIGVYPDQDKELLITDIYEQYNEFEKYINRIPEHIEVVMIPGNHDVVRLQEPQPRIGKDFLPTTFDLKNVHSIPSPSYVDLHDVLFCLYHGYSMDPTIAVCNELSYDHPEEVMVEFLRKRHLMPRYGSTERGARTSLFPEKEDLLALDKVPDVLVTGHVHRNGYSQYRSTLVVNPGTWQLLTNFQAKLGHIISPGIVPTINLQNFGIQETRFISDSV